MARLIPVKKQPKKAVKTVPQRQVLRAAHIKAIGSFRVTDWSDTSTSWAGNIAAKAVGAIVDYFETHKKPGFVAAVGYSGLALGSLVSFALNVPIVLMRNSHPDRFDKNGAPDEISRALHWNVHPMQQPKNSSYIFVDDLIDSGLTLARMWAAMNKLGHKCTHVALGDGVDKEMLLTVFKPGKVLDKIQIVPTHA